MNERIVFSAPILYHEGDARVFEGHAFIIEAAVSLGGKDVKAGINVYRFANRIPLLFEGGSDVITKTALKRISWSTYKINQNTDKVNNVKGLQRRQKMLISIALHT